MTTFIDKVFAAAAMPVAAIPSIGAVKQPVQMFSVEVAPYVVARRATPPPRRHSVSLSHSMPRCRCRRHAVVTVVSPFCAAMPARQPPLFTSLFTPPRVLLLIMNREHYGFARRARAVVSPLFAAFRHMPRLSSSPWLRTHEMHRGP